MNEINTGHTTVFRTKQWKLYYQRWAAMRPDIYTTHNLQNEQEKKNQRIHL